MAKREKRTPYEIAKILAKIYKKEFWGDKKANYKITLTQLLALAGKKSFDEIFLRKIRNEVLEKGYAFIYLGDEFAIQKEKKMRGHRQVSKEVLAEYGVVISQTKKVKESREKDRKKEHK